MKKITYDKAYAELTTILNDLQSGELSIDDLSKSSKRAKELLLFCKERLRSIEHELLESDMEE